MLTVLLVVVLAVVTVAASELVRSKCRRMLRTPLRASRTSVAPAAVALD